MRGAAFRICTDKSHGEVQIWGKKACLDARHSFVTLALSTGKASSHSMIYKGACAWCYVTSKRIHFKFYNICQMNGTNLSLWQAARTRWPSEEENDLESARQTVQKSLAEVYLTEEELQACDEAPNDDVSLRKREQLAKLLLERAYGVEVQNTTGTTAAERFGWLMNSLSAASTAVVVSAVIKMYMDSRK